MDLDDMDEKAQKKGIMRLQLLDLRENKISKVFQKEAIVFLRETVILLWDNPLEDGAQLALERYDPSCFFRSSELDDDETKILKPIVIYRATPYLRSVYEDI